MDYYKEEKIHFGTGGWRGVIGDDFTRRNIQKVATGIALLAREEHKDETPIIIGYDRRFLSWQASNWVAQTLCAMGISVRLMERSTPTPLIMYLVQETKYHFGIEITASHNPSQYNGIKLIVDEGRDAPVETTNHLEALIAGVADIPDMSLDKAKEKGLAVYLHAPFNSFIDHILELLNQDAIRKRNLRILFNPMHGSGVYPLTVILNSLRCTVDTVNDQKDAWFGGTVPAPSEERLKEFSYKVVAGGYDLGIAFDGDGDRLGVIDEKGRYISANEILCLLYNYLHEVKGWKGPVIRNLATTHLLDKLAESFGETCYEVPIGFKYISSAIDKHDAILGGESSGGLTVRGHIHGKDSVYAASLFIEMVCATGKTPAQMLKEFEDKFGTFVLVEANLAFAPEKKPEIMHTVMEEKKIPVFDKKPVRVNYEDGCKVYFDDDSFVICRFSGTEPLLRIFAEGRNKDIAQKYIDAFREMLKL